MNKYILCCDWGTTSFRLRLVDRYTYEVAGELLSSGGVAGTFRSWKEQIEINRFDYYFPLVGVITNQGCESASGTVRTPTRGN